MLKVNRKKVFKYWNTLTRDEQLGHYLINGNRSHLRLDKHHSAMVNAYLLHILGKGEQFYLTGKFPSDIKVMASMPYAGNKEKALRSDPTYSTDELNEHC